MHLDVTIIVFSVINFLIVVLIIQHFLLKPVLKIIDARKTKLAESLAQAEEDKKQARQMLAKSQRDSKAEQERLRALLERTNKSIKQKQADTVTSLQSTAREQLRKAREDMMLERDRNLRTHQKEIVDLSANIAEQLLRGADNKAIQKQQIDRFIEELEAADINRRNA